MTLKEWLQLIGLIGSTLIGGLIGIILIALFLIAVASGPIVVVIWVVWKLFFN